MSYVPFDPEEAEDYTHTAADLTVEWTEPQVIATLLGPDGEPLLELTDREPPGFRVP